MKRREFMVAAAASIATGSVLQADDEKMVRVYYGTKNKAGSEGIYTGMLALEDGYLSPPQLAAKAENPGFIAISASGRFLYASESGKSGSRIVAYAIDKKSGKLAKLNSRDAGGANPCHVSVGPGNQYVVYANYTGGSCGMMSVREDGALKMRSSFFQHEGASGVNEKRQKAPHPHSANTDPSGRFVMVADLGQDKVRVYRVDADGKSMTPNEPAYVKTPAGGGPRHVTFHPSNQWMYANNELTSSISVYDLNKTTGELKSKQTITTLPDGFKEGNSTAEILIHPNGKFLYCSNRGHDSIAVFSIDQKTGQLTAIGHTKTGGQIPRNFGITPDGRFLVAANQNSNNVLSFSISPTTGKLTATGSEIKVPHCICVRFAN